jgi:tripartite-type tricarboxylate transporter receptor subunit TctC
MRLARRQLLGLAVATTALPAISHIAMAQTYPSRPVTMLVPYSAGGATDTTGRIVAEGMRGRGSDDANRRMPGNRGADRQTRAVKGYVHKIEAERQAELFA